MARGTPVALETKGTVREARGFTSRMYTRSLRMAYWMFISPLTCKLPGQGVGVLLDDLDQLIAQGVRGEDAGAVPGMDAGLFDVLHDARR